MSLKDVEDAIEWAFALLPGWCTPEKGRRMAAFAHGASLCVELGVFGGRGLSAMALALKDQGSGQADGIDPYTVDAALEGTNHPANAEWWSGLDYRTMEQVARDAIERQKLESFARIVRKRSADAVVDYADGSVDVLHQDSNHSEEVSCEEVVLWTPKMRPKGIWIFDDTDWPSTARAQEMLEERGFIVLEDHVSWKVYRVP